MSIPSKSTKDIDFTVENSVGVITLNRPKALNALSYDMVARMSQQLQAWQVDDQVKWVLVCSSFPRAFCAGGDVRALYELGDDIPACEAYFIEEYKLNHLIHHYAKPYVALMDGIVMGGGMGVSQGAGLRIVSEVSRLAMPETAIGMVPDVGGSYFLSRAHNNPAIGRYLAVTGAIINARDACSWHLADILVAQKVLPNLLAELKALPEPTLVNLHRVAKTFSCTDLLPHFESVAQFEATILEVFSEDNELSVIFERLKVLADEAGGDESQAQWAKNTLAQMEYNSPVAMRLALHNQHIGRSASLGECLRLEFNSISNLLRLGEAPEGIRAKIIDKDNAPKWRRANIEFDFARLSAFPYALMTHPLKDLA